MKLLLILILFGVAGCGAATIPHAGALPASQMLANARRSPELIYVSDRSSEQLFTYFSGNNSPIRSQSLAHAGGVATDAAGNVYVANGSDVLEFNRGAVRLIRRYSANLYDAMNVAIGPDRSLYVADHGAAAGTGQIVVFGKNARIIPVPTGMYPHALAVDKNGDLFFEVSGDGDSWPLNGNCQAVNIQYELPAGSNTPKPLRIYGEQNWGMTFVGNTLYVSDYCLGTIDGYSPPDYSFKNYVNFGDWNNLPVYISASASQLIIPQARTGQVILVPVAGNGAPVTVTGLPGPIGAAAGP